MGLLEVGQQFLDVDDVVRLVGRHEILDVCTEDGAALAVLLHDRVVRHDRLGLRPGRLRRRVDLVPGLVDPHGGVQRVERLERFRILARARQAAGLVGAVVAVPRVERDHDLLPGRPRRVDPRSGLGRILERRVVVRDVPGRLDAKRQEVRVGEHRPVLVRDPGEQRRARARGRHRGRDQQGEEDSGESKSEPHAIPRSSRSLPPWRRRSPPPGTTVALGVGGRRHQPAAEAARADSTLRRG